MVFLIFIQLVNLSVTPETVIKTVQRKWKIQCIESKLPAIYKHRVKVSEQICPIKRLFKALLIAFSLSLSLSLSLSIPKYKINFKFLVQGKRFGSTHRKAASQRARPFVSTEH